MQAWVGNLWSAASAAGLLWAGLILSVPAAGQTPNAPAGQEVVTPLPVETHEVHNVWRLSRRVLSGSEPKNDAAFAELVSLGVKTIVSVDGVAPRVELAQKHGLRYVHIPIGYDSVPKDAACSLTRVARDVSGTIYVHCHHGKHRGPAAAAVLCRADDGRSSAGALVILEKAGTGREYPGLWRSVTEFRLPPPDADLPELTEHAQVDSLAAAMAKVDRIFERLKTNLQTTPVKAPRQESLMVDSVQLAELFVESARLATDVELRQGLEAAGRTAQELSGLLADEAGSSRGQQARNLVNRLSQSCTTCHRQHRN